MEERVFLQPEWFDGKNVNELKFYSSFKRQHELTCYNGQFYGKNGFIAEEKIKCLIAEKLIACFFDNLEKRASALLKSIRMFASFEEWKPNPNLIHVKNGTLDITTRMFKTEREICQARLEVEFDPDAPSPEVWLRFLSELLTADDIKILQEYMGYCLIPTNRAQKMLILIGRGGEGKSRIGVVMSKLFGTACVGGSIRRIETNRFAAANLEGKLVMVDDDLDMSALPSTNNLKTIVTAEAPIELERKGIQSHQGMLNTRFLCFGNGVLTALYDSTDGFYRRQIILNTLKRPRDRVDDPYLTDKLARELPGILLWCLEGLKRLIDADYRFSISEHTMRDMQELRRDANNILDFIRAEGYLRFDPKACITSASLYECYRRWCDDNSCRPFSAQRLISELRSREDDYNIAYTNKIPIGSGRYVRGFRGLATMEYPFGINEARVGACANTHEE
ncbi:MAG: DNA primase [Ruminococcaceae bacterium]|nr:DNA primase [Oscillospiraceae bacterium]